MRDSKGRFMPGFDPDRHKLTLEDCKKGYFNTAWGTIPNMRQWRWIMRKIARYYGREYLGLHPATKKKLKRLNKHKKPKK